MSLFQLLAAIKLVFSSAAAMSAVFGLPSQVRPLILLASRFSLPSLSDLPSGC